MSHAVRTVSTSTVRQACEILCCSQWSSILISAYFTGPHVSNVVKLPTDNSVTVFRNKFICQGQKRKFVAHCPVWLWFTPSSVNWLQIIFQTLTWLFSTQLHIFGKKSVWVPIRYVDVASVYSVQSQNQIPHNFSCLLVSQRKIGNRMGIWETGCFHRPLWGKTQHVRLGVFKTRNGEMTK